MKAFNPAPATQHKTIAPIIVAKGTKIDRISGAINAIIRRKIANPIISNAFIESPMERW